jgi:hypothetical protein
MGRVIRYDVRNVHRRNVAVRKNRSANGAQISGANVRNRMSAPLNSYSPCIQSPKTKSCTRCLTPPPPLVLLVVEAQTHRNRC